MRIGSILKSNKGTALITVIMMIIVMSLLGITLVIATLSGFRMSIFFSDSNKAYFAAEAAVEQVANVLDERVADNQEDARIEASDYIQVLLQENPNYIRNSDGTIKQSVVDEEFRTKYLSVFYTGLDSEFQNIDADYLKGLLNTATVDVDGNVYKELNENQERMVLESAVYDNINHKLSIAVSGVFNDSKKKLDVAFNLLPDPSQTPYRGIQKAVINKRKTLPDIFRKAVVAEKNMIAAGGNVNINGNVLCFGSVPSDAGGEEDQSAPWYRYGGILAGISSEVANNSSEFDFDSSKTGSFKSGSILINGDAATTGYIHSIYGTDTNPSDITVTGKSYARAVRSEEYSNYSQIDLQNDVYTMDNLQIDSNETTVNVGGKYYGFVDAGYMIDGSGTDTPEKVLQDETEYKRTSSIVVNGDSYLNMNGEVYIGGSTFFKKILDTNGNPYMSGISAMKSGRRVSNAFKKDDAANPGNLLYWYENGAYVSPLPAPNFKTYTESGNPVDMFSGKAGDPDYFPITSRAMHFKGIWDNLWKNDEVFSSFLNMGNINILGNGIAADGKLKGYSNGAVIANGKVFGIDEFEGGHDPVVFHAIQEQCILDFHNAVKDLLAESYSADAPKLNYVAPSRHLYDYKDSSNTYIGTQKIVANEPYVVPETGIFYYGTQDTDITQNAGKWYIGGLEMPMAKGIIYIDGNLYVGDGFNFNGIVMASKNIIFQGNSTITYDTTVDRLFDSDVNINGFFKLLVCEVPDEKLLSQRISTKNISIDSWNEVSIY